MVFPLFSKKGGDKKLPKENNKCVAVCAVRSFLREVETRGHLHYRVFHLIKYNDFAVACCPQSLHIISNNKGLYAKHLVAANNFPLLKFFGRLSPKESRGKNPNIN